MAPRIIPIHPIGTQVPMFMGGDRGLVILLGTTAGALITTYDPAAMVTGAGLWFVGLWGARALAQFDPRFMQILARSLPGKYQNHYLARSTPWRENTTNQVRGYRR